MLKFLICIFLTISIFGQSELDKEISLYIKKFQYKSIRPLGPKRVGLYNLGKELFFEKEVSGNRNMSCSVCHVEAHGFGDGLPLSIGEGGVGEGVKRKTTARLQITPRNSPSLFNVGHPDIKALFWDGRVQFDKDTHILITPEKNLYGANPKYKEIAEVFTSALSILPLFPPTSIVEMRGREGENEISKRRQNIDIQNIEIWNAIMDRLLKIEKYQKLFTEAYGENVKFNIGHFGEAIGEFIRHEFYIDNTPWDRYLKGDLNALSDNEKRGVIAFSTTGKCSTCHHGELLGGVEFFGVASPQIGPGEDRNRGDQGFYRTTKKESDRFHFKAPMLRNVAKTAPYFHNGALFTLREVIDHYTKNLGEVDSFNQEKLAWFEKNNYGEKIYIETTKDSLFRRKKNAHPFIRFNTIKLSEEEKKNIELFMSKSLTQE